ncbi:MAG: hypothetical protein P8J86_05780 [Phycisphaerales bacterium]|nr:hypothetical protein [Phycisphaerales bacterium]
MSPHLDLGSWREWDRGLRHYRVAASSKKSLLWIGAPLLAVLILLHFYLSFWIYSSGIGVIMPAFFLWYLIDHALTARRRLSPRDNFFDKVIARGGLVCPQCEVPLEAASAPDRWSCSQCASSYTGQQLTRLIDGKFAKFRAADASPVWKWIYRKLGLHAATDRIALAFCSVEFAIIGLTFYLLLASLFGLIEAEIFDRNVSVFAFLPPAFIIIGTVLIIGGIRLRREPYSRCAHCFYTVPEGIALPDRCSECGCSWHAPGGLLHHRIEWRPVGYGGLVFSLLALLLLGNGMYRDWQLNQALQTPTTATASALIAGLGQDNGYWGDDAKALQAELHQRNLTPLEDQSLVKVYITRLEGDESLGNLGWNWLISMIDSGQLDAATEDRVVRASPSISSSYGVDWKYEVPSRPSISLVRHAQIPVQAIALQVVINGEEQECSIGPWKRGNRRAAIQVAPYVPRKSRNLIEVTVWFSEAGFKIDNEAHLAPAYLREHAPLGVWSVSTEFEQLALEVPKFAFGDVHFRSYIHPDSVLGGYGAARKKEVTIKAPKLTSQQAIELVDAKAALGALVKDPILQVAPVTESGQLIWDEAVIEVVRSSGSTELDQLVVNYMELADIEFGVSCTHVQIDLDSLHPAVAEVTP